MAHNTIIIKEGPEPWYRKLGRTIKNPKVAPYIAVGIFLLVGIGVTIATLRPPHIRTRAVTRQAKVSLLPATLSLPPTGTLQLWATTDSALVFVNVEVTFDPAVVKLASEAALTTSSWGRVIKQTPMATANTTGKIDLVIGLDPTLKSATPSGTFQLATLQFGANTTASNATTSVGFTTASMQLVAADTTVFAVTTAGSTVVVNPTLTPTPTPTAGVTPTATVTPLPTPQSNDTTPPVVTITTPVNGSAVPAKGSMSIQVTASDASGIGKITIALDGTVTKTCTGATTCQVNTAVTKIAAGSHTITATATDTSTNKNTASTTVTVTK
jgi:hypothetical protein